MTALVPGVEIMAVADLYNEYGRLARAYTPEDNPLHALTGMIPARAQFYTIVPETKRSVAETLMRRISGRRKLRHMVVDKDDIRHPIFAPSRNVVVFYA